VSESHKTPFHLLLQQSVVWFHEESLVGLPSSFWIWRRALLSFGLHFSENEGMMKCCVVRTRRRSSMHEGKCCMVDIIFFNSFCFLLGFTSICYIYIYIGNLNGLLTIDIMLKKLGVEI